MLLQVLLQVLPQVVNLQIQLRQIDFLKFRRIRNLSKTYPFLGYFLLSIISYRPDRYSSESFSSHLSSFHMLHFVFPFFFFSFLTSVSPPHTLCHCLYPRPG